MKKQFWAGMIIGLIGPAVVVLVSAWFIRGLGLAGIVAFPLALIAGVATMFVGNLIADRLVGTRRGGYAMNQVGDHRGRISTSGPSWCRVLHEAEKFAREHDDVK